MPYYRGKTSEVWNHFVVMADDKAKCGYCSSKLSFSSGNTANLKRHLMAKHPTVPLNRCDSSRNQREGNILMFLMFLYKSTTLFFNTYH